MRPIYNQPKDDKKASKPTSSFMPLHMQHCLKMSSQNSTKEYKAEASKANAKNNFKVTEQTAYKQAKQVSKETSTKNYKKSGEEAIKQFKVSSVLVKYLSSQYILKNNILYRKNSEIVENKTKSITFKKKVSINVEEK